jgi:hypothetical protein
MGRSVVNSHYRLISHVLPLYMPYCWRGYRSIRFARFGSGLFTDFLMSLLPCRLWRLLVSFFITTSQFDKGLRAGIDKN